MTSLFRSFFILLMIAGCNFAYADQYLYSFHAAFHNICAYSIHITAYPYANIYSWDIIRDQHLESDETTTIFLHRHFSKDIQKVVPDDYKLEITANGKTISLDKAQFLKVLKKSDFSNEKCGLFILDLFCSTDQFSGTIKDPSLCP